ncbi:MAG: hypothetical protein QOJ50_2137, partial [Cryptosporangiaceae bacterium]|nr:hypothetical protein [Cryptosporangiaceae bacterium]
APRLADGSVVWGRGERFGFASRPGGRVYCFGTASLPAGGAAAGGEYAEVVRRFGDWPEPIPTLLAAVAPGAVLRHDVYDLPPLPSFVPPSVPRPNQPLAPQTPNLKVRLEH